MNDEAVYRTAPATPGLLRNEEEKNENFAFFKGYIYTRGISPISIINWKKNNKIKKQILKCLPNLWETFIEVQSVHSICFKIGVKLKSSTLYR